MNSFVAVTSALLQNYLLPQVCGSGGKRQSLWMRRRMREGEKQVDKGEEEERGHSKRRRVKEGEKEARSSCIERSEVVTKSIERVKLKEEVDSKEETKTEGDPIKVAEKQDKVEQVDKTLENCEIQSLDERGKSQKYFSAEETKFGNRTVLSKGAESDDGEEKDEGWAGISLEKEREGAKDEEGGEISLAMTVPSRSGWPHLTGSVIL